MYDAEFRKRFHGRVEKQPSGCWHWVGYVSKKLKYGMFQCRRFSSKPFYSHRTAWELANGAIPGKLHVLHDCDNPVCCNPKHLFLGTQVDNNKDRDRKGRTASGDRNGASTQRHRNPFVKNRGSGLSGEAHPMTKISDAQVVRICKLHKKGWTMTRLAKKYKLSIAHVSKIVKREIRKGAMCQ